MIHIEQLNKKFGQEKVIHNLNLRIDAPGLYVLVGSNGSGKTTLLNLVTGLILRDDGSISINDSSDIDTSRSKIGIASEPFQTEPSLTVKEIVNICSVIKRADHKEGMFWLQYWDLLACQEKPFRTLSTGMKKRLSLALSLIGNPHLLIWDEPFNGIDPVGISILNQLIKEQIALGKYILISSHLINEITIPDATFLIVIDGKIVDIFNKANTSDSSEKILKSLIQEP